ncbi:MAG TPA: helix-turn-helix domain-containing protein, partial [Thermomicrobiales bacterium]|nr:helix-turn-helix domain-containing protein [Thermomicrobiales bacterium]
DMSNEQPDEWMTVQEVASDLKVNEETVRRWIRNGELDVLALGTSNRAGYRIRKRALDTFIAERYGPKGKAAA